MKALLLKDFYVLLKQLRFLLILLVLFSVLPGLSSSVFAMLYAVMLPVTTLGYDERSKWDQLAVMMPYTQQQLVCSKYFLGYIGAGGVAVISFIAQVIYNLVIGEPFSAGLLINPIVTPCVGLLLLAVNLPVMFRFGTEKGRLLYLLTIAILSGMAALPQTSWMASQSVSPSLLLLLLPLVTLAVNLLSIKLSVRIYQKIH